MNASYVRFALSGAAAVTTLCLYAVRWRRGKRRPEQSCRQMRGRALEIVARSESLAALARGAAATPPAGATWDAIRTQHRWLASALPELRVQLHHLGLRRATGELRESLDLLDLEFRRHRSELIPSAAEPIDENSITWARFREKVDEFTLAARFMSIVAHVDECAISGSYSSSCVRLD